MTHSKTELFRKVHILKTWPQYFDAVFNGKKNFEVRKNDRDYQVGDCIDLMEYDPNTNLYTGAHCHRVITFILNHDNPFIDLKDNMVILSLQPIEQPGEYPADVKQLMEQYGVTESDIEAALKNYCKGKQPEQSHKTAEEIIIQDNKDPITGKLPSLESLENNNLSYDLHGVIRLMEEYHSQFSKEVSDEVAQLI